MAFPRTQHQLTVLPDGTVLATGGSRNSDVTDRASAVLAAELWNPVTETWRTLSSGAVPRLYHSSATLLPDGRVKLAGGGHPPASGSRSFATRVFSPPYLFKGPRPTITSAPAQANYGQTFFVADSRRLHDHESRPHPAADPDPRVQLELRLRTALLLPDVRRAHGHGPANGNLAPPGMYMLFAINSNGVPSVAFVVQSRCERLQCRRCLDAPRESAWYALTSRAASRRPHRPRRLLRRY